MVEANNNTASNNNIGKVYLVNIVSQDSTLTIHLSLSVEAGLEVKDGVK